MSAPRFLLLGLGLLPLPGWAAKPVDPYPTPAIPIPAFAARTCSVMDFGASGRSLAPQLRLTPFVTPSTKSAAGWKEPKPARNASALAATVSSQLHFDTMNRKNILAAAWFLVLAAALHAASAASPANIVRNLDSQVSVILHTNGHKDLGRGYLTAVIDEGPAGTERVPLPSLPPRPGTGVPSSPGHYTYQYFLPLYVHDQK